MSEPAKVYNRDGYHIHYLKRGGKETLCGQTVKIGWQLGGGVNLYNVNCQACIDKARKR